MTAFSLVTLPYRAPELYFQAPNFGFPIDMWALGIVLAELCGETWHKTGQAALLEKMTTKFRAPPASVTSAWAKWGGRCGASVDQAWPAQVRERIGTSGEMLLSSLLRLDPAARPTANEAQNSRFVVPHAMVGGDVVSPGARHDWAITAGCMDTATLAWLREDLQDTSSLNVAFEGPGTKRRNVKVEEARKFILAGKMVEEPWSGSLCALSLAALLPLPRVRAWFEAFKQVNKHSLEPMQAQMRQVTDGSEGGNAEEFLTLPLSSWFLSAAEVAVSDARGRWEEPLHQDGGASVVHLSVTLFGKRTLTCHTGKVKGTGAQVRLLNYPGLVYMGGLTGPWHQARPTLARGFSAS